MGRAGFKISTIVLVSLILGAAVDRFWDAPKEISFSEKCSEPYVARKTSPICVHVSAEHNSGGSQMIKLLNKCNEPISISRILYEVRSEDSNANTNYLEKVYKPIKVGAIGQSEAERISPARHACLDVAPSSSRKCEFFDIPPESYLEFIVDRNERATVTGALPSSFLSNGRVELIVDGPNGPFC